MKIDLGKAIKRATTISSEAKKGWGSKKQATKSKPVKKKRRRKKPPMTMEQKNAAETQAIENMGFKPLGYWAKQFERFVD